MKSLLWDFGFVFIFFNGAKRWTRFPSKKAGAATTGSGDGRSWFPSEEAGEAAGFYWWRVDDGAAAASEAGAASSAAAAAFKEAAAADAVHDYATATSAALSSFHSPSSVSRLFNSELVVKIETFWENRFYLRSLRWRVCESCRLFLANLFIWSSNLFKFVCYIQTFWLDV